MAVIPNKIRLRLFSVLVTIYMVAALSWWAILLLNKSQEIHDLTIANSEYKAGAASELKRQQYMIAGEGLVFALSLIVGIFLLTRAFRREVASARQQKNFLLSVTHELKSPITAIQLILETFKKRKLNEKQMTSLIENGQDETTRLMKLIEDLLTAAKLNPKSTFQREMTNLSEILNKLKDQYISKLQGHRIEIHNLLPAQEVYTHEASLFLIFSNLLDNAIKYSEKGSIININIEEEDQRIQVNICDTGIGIPQSEKQKIFEQFYRIGDENTRSSQGTGLGLYLVNKLCKKLGIKISVTDNEPKGSIFVLSIPTKE